MSAKVIDLIEYRKRKQEESAGKRLRGLGFPDDFNPFEGGLDTDFLESLCFLEQETEEE